MFLQKAQYGDVVNKLDVFTVLSYDYWLQQCLDYAIDVKTLICVVINPQLWRLPHAENEILSLKKPVLDPQMFVNSLKLKLKWPSTAAQPVTYGHLNRNPAETTRHQGQYLVYLTLVLDWWSVPCSQCGIPVASAVSENNSTKAL